MNSATRLRWVLEQADEAAKSGYNLLAIGEMGIGNTTSASAITCALAGASAEHATGSGTGVTAPARAHKVKVVQAVLDHHFVKKARAGAA